MGDVLTGVLQKLSDDRRHRPSLDDECAHLPEILQTCHGSLHTGLEVQTGETLLIRGGTSSIGLTTLAMAKHAGLKVISTSRSEAKVDVLRAAGADEVVIDAGKVAERVRALHPQGVDRVLELIGTTTLLDSLQCARSGGVVCMTGILGGQWELPLFRPMGHIPTAVWGFDQLPVAHRAMDENRANGKMVVVVR